MAPSTPFAATLNKKSPIAVLKCPEKLRKKDTLRLADLLQALAKFTSAA
jgi:hypothetical protein